MKEVFGAGTACVICPVKDILYDNQVFLGLTKDNLMMLLRCGCWPKRIEMYFISDVGFGKF